MMVMRAATEADAPAVLAMVRAQLFEEQPDAAFSPGRAADALHDCMRYGAVIVSVADAAVVGTCALMPESAALSDGEWLRMMWCFVRVEHRRAPHMRELLRAARAAGVAADLPVRLECHGGERLQGKMGLIRRELGDSDGVTFTVRN